MKFAQIIEIILLACILYILLYWMPKRDEQVDNTAVQFYKSCMARENERVIVESHAGNWTCNQRHSILTFAQVR